MGLGGGDKKQYGDGNVVVLRNDATAGSADIWDLREIAVAFIEEREALRAAVAASADFAAFKLAVADLPRSIVIIDSLVNVP